MFRATTQQNETSQILKHFGDNLEVAITRAVAIFSGIEQYAANLDGSFVYAPNDGKSVTNISSEEFKAKFISQMKSVRIFQYDKPKGKSLSLNDVWMDDPIGSGGLDIIQKENLSNTEYSELKQLFAPFTGIIYPQHIMQAHSASEISKIYKTIRKVKLGKEELSARKHRSALLGESWPESKPQETVWVNLTLELRKWAISHDYDYFSYHNTEESDGSLCFVALSNNSFGRPIAEYAFDEERYLKIPADAMKSRSNLFHLNGHNNIMIDDLIWCGQAPADFWLKSKC